MIVLLSLNLAIRNIAVRGFRDDFLCVTHDVITVLNSHAVHDAVQYSSRCDIVNDENLYNGKNAQSPSLTKAVLYITSRVICNVQTVTFIPVRTPVGGETQNNSSRGILSLLLNLIPLPLVTA